MFSFSACSHAGNGKEFFIRNKLTGLVLELKDGQKKAKTDVVTSYRQPDTDDETRQQLFYVDEPTGTIKSAANDMCLDIPGTCARPPDSFYNRIHNYSPTRKFTICTEPLYMAI